MESFKCDFCPKSFKTRSGKFYHMRNSKSDCRLKNLTAPISEQNSDFVTNSSNSLLEHKMITTLSKTCICLHCIRTFSRKGNLKRHEGRCKQKAEHDLLEKMVQKIEEQNKKIEEHHQTQLLHLQKHQELEKQIAKLTQRPQNVTVNITYYNYNCLQIAQFPFNPTKDKRQIKCITNPITFFEVPKATLTLPRSSFLTKVCLDLYANPNERPNNIVFCVTDKHRKELDSKVKMPIVNAINNEIVGFRDMDIDSRDGILAMLRMATWYIYYHYPDKSITFNQNELKHQVYTLIRNTLEIDYKDPEPVDKQMIKKIKKAFYRKKHILLPIVQNKTPYPLDKEMLEMLKNFSYEDARTLAIFPEVQQRRRKKHKKRIIAKKVTRPYYSLQRV